MAGIVAGIVAGSHSASNYLIWHKQGLGASTVHSRYTNIHPAAELRSRNRYISVSNVHNFIFGAVDPIHISYIFLYIKCSEYIESLL